VTEGTDDVPYTRFTPLAYCNIPFQILRLGSTYTLLNIRSPLTTHLLNYSAMQCGKNWHFCEYDL